MYKSIIIIEILLVFVKNLKNHSFCHNIFALKFEIYSFVDQLCHKFIYPLK